jgi:hypothetical protein
MRLTLASRQALQWLGLMEKTESACGLASAWKPDDEERRRAAGEDVVELDPGTNDPKKLRSIAEYRANKAERSSRAGPGNT